MMAAARASVALASAFSSSVRVMIRKESSSSFSVPSNRSVGLSGAIWGKSGRTIGADRTVSWAGLPTRTGQVCSLEQAATAGRAHSGGSTSDTNRPPVTPTSR